MKKTMAGAVMLAAVLAAVSALPVSAQQDQRWAPFVGCWVPAGAPENENTGLLCFRPSGSGVEMFNVFEGEVTATEQLVADSQPRPVSAEGCTGSEQVAFSEDGMRAYTRSEFQCGAENRQGSGVMSFLEPDQWIDVRALTVSGDPVAWAQAYELATPERLSSQGIADPAAGNETLIRAARVRAARDIDLDDVEDVVRRVETRAVEIWVAANETPFELDGKELVRLADSGIPESVIDVMVAVTYPERFVLSPEGVASEAERTLVAEGYPAGYRRGYRSYLLNPWIGPYSFGYAPYSRFGYYGYGPGGYGGYWGYYPATIIVRPAEPVDPPVRGRIVPGRGYTREGGSNNGGGGGSGGARPSSSGDRGSSGGNDSSGSSNSGGGSSSGGDGGGRRAVPR